MQAARQFTLRVICKIELNEAMKQIVAIANRQYPELRLPVVRRQAARSRRNAQPMLTRLSHRRQSAADARTLHSVDRLSDDINDAYDLALIDNFKVDDVIARYSDPVDTRIFL